MTHMVMDGMGGVHNYNGVNYCDDFWMAANKLKPLPCNIIDNLCAISISPGMFGSEITRKLLMSILSRWRLGDLIKVTTS